MECGGKRSATPLLWGIFSQGGKLFEKEKVERVRQNLLLPESVLCYVI
jgi:hypothetical protein